MKSNTAIKLITGAGAAVAAYIFWIRPWQLRWGSTRWEWIRPMEGDDIVQKPDFVATRAVTVNAPPEKVWPWILQMGCGRGGWYSYDGLDNQFQPSARSILLEYQHPKPGDVIPVNEQGNDGFRVRAFRENEWMLWEDMHARSETTWCWGFYPLRDKHTRLVTRLRVRYDWSFPAILQYLLVDFGDFIMMRKCMLGIKERAEALVEERAQ